MTNIYVFFYECEPNIGLQMNIQAITANNNNLKNPKLFKRSVVYDDDKNNNPHRIRQDCNRIIISYYKQSYEIRSCFYMLRSWKQTVDV